MPHPDPIIDYLKIEQPQRRTEIENYITRIEADQRYGILSTGLTWSWLLINHDKLLPPFSSVASLIAPLLIVFFLIRWYSFDFEIIRIAKYMQSIEEKFGLGKLSSHDSDKETPTYGWESYLDDKRDKSGKTKDALAQSALIYWWVLLAVNVAVAFVFWWIS